MTDTTVYVSGLSPDSTQESITHFFSFCGTIKSVERHEKNATIVFEKPSAAKTSMLLDGGSLDNSTISVKAGSTGASGSAAAEPTRPTSAEGDEVKQEDKPRSAIAAEYLAHGYVLGDNAISKAIALDQQHGISAKFLSYWGKIDSKYQLQQKATAASSEATTRAATVDEKSGHKFSSLFSTGRAYYEKALASPHGEKVRQFYTNVTSQASEVHAEAKRIAELKAGKPVFAQKLPGGTSETAPATGAPAATTPAPAVATATPTEKSDAAGYDVKA